jgi:hypothetical protein
MVGDGDKGLQEANVEHSAHARNIAHRHVSDQIYSLLTRCALG